jgi:hypothetical protein
MDTLNILNEDEIMTGDIILCSSNTATGIFLKSFTSSNWNHAGIAIRIYNDKISINKKGTLHVLEINSGYRYDILSKKYKKGTGLTNIKILYKKYNIMAVRRLLPLLRISDLEKLTTEFIKEFGSKEFTSSPKAFIGVWLAVPLVEETRKEIFCTELVAYYYKYCIGPIIENKLNRSSDKYFKDIFGLFSPYSSCLFKPETFTYRATPDAPIFIGKEELFYYDPADVGVTVTAQIIVTLFVLVVISTSIS